MSNLSVLITRLILRTKCQMVNVLELDLNKVAAQILNCVKKGSNYQERKHINHIIVYPGFLVTNAILKKVFDSKIRPTLGSFYIGNYPKRHYIYHQSIS
ncbi:MAG: hypothetical protein IPO14_00020 [Saprospiraceae bacterium]|nr:hypothetical protein [Saprospiraceae bacterium]